MKPSWDGGVQIVYVIWPRWPSCPYLIKTFKNPLHWNQNADDLETWYATLITQVCLMVALDVLDLFYSKVNFCFCMGKCLNCRLPRKTSEPCEVKVCACTGSQINEFVTIYDNPRSRSFIDVCPSLLRFTINTFRFHLIISMWSNRHFNCVYKNNKLVQKWCITICVYSF